jgi:hypothetical protein
MFHGLPCVKLGRLPQEKRMRPLEQQIGGSHYKKLAIQPIEYIHGNGIGYMEGNAIKYLTRWRDKGGVQDLEKARHYIDLLIDMETNGLEKLMPHDDKQIPLIEPPHFPPSQEPAHIPPMPEDDE